MKKVVMAVLAVCLLATGAFAGPYAGFQIGPNFPTASDTQVLGKSTSNLTFDTGIALGAQVGFDFNDPRYEFPYWAKYFSVALDYQFNTMDLSNRGIGNRDGNQNALSLLGIAKYPMMETADYPRGRLFPYIGVGPSIVWTSLGNRNSTNIGVVTEPGVRYMFTPNISGDVAYRFRYAQPSDNDLQFNSLNHTVLLRANYHW